jgi:hypothetical protein
MMRGWGRRRRDREGRLGAEPIVVLPDGDQELAGDVGSDPVELEQPRVDRGDQWLDQSVELIDLLAE